MAKGEYVDIDIYGRAFDGVFGRGAEKENRRQALMKFEAARRFKERVKPGEYIDLDLYGRGDPRIFGPGAHIQTQKEAQRYLEEAQRCKEDRHMNRHAVGLKENEQEASSLLRSTSSAGRAELEKEVEGAPVDNSQEHQETVTHHDGLIPTETIANNDLLGQQIVVNNATTAPLPENLEVDEIVPNRVPNDKETTPAEDGHEEDEIVPAHKTPTPAQHELEGGKVAPADLAINSDDAVAPIDEKEEKEANSRKVFSFKLRALAKKASSLVKRLSSGRRETEKEDEHVRNSEKREAQDVISHEAGPIPAETKADEQGIVTNDETPVPLAANSEEEDIVPNEEAVAPVEGERDEKVNNGIVDDDATFAPIDDKEEKPTNSPRVFSSKLKTLARKASSLVKRMSSGKREPDNENGYVAVNDDGDEQEAHTSHVGLIPAETKGDDDDILSNDEAPAFPADQHEEEDATANDEALAYAEAEKDIAVDQKHEAEEHAPRLSDRVVDQSNNVDNTPRRVRSKLPSEEAPPDAYVERGHVARVIKSISSLEQGLFQEKKLSEQPRLAEYSSHPLHGTSSAEVSEPGSSEGADKSSKEGSKKEVHERVLPEAAITNEEEAARGIFVDSDEEFSLSFSTPQKNGGNGNGSTSSEEDLRLRVTQQEGVPIDNAGIYGIGKKRFAGLFRSGDTDSGSDNDGAEFYSHKPGGSSNTPEATIKDPGGKKSDSGSDKDGAEFYSQKPGGPSNTPEATIIDLGGKESTGEYVNTSEKLVQAADIPINAVQPKEDPSEEVPEQAVEQGTYFKSDTNSSGAVEHEDNGASVVENASNEHGSESATDSDRSAEASSSSVEEDSDDIEVEVVDDLEGFGEVEEEEQEEIDANSDEVVSEVRVVSGMHVDMHVDDVRPVSDILVVDSLEAGPSSEDNNAKVEDAGNNGDTDGGNNGNDGNQENQRDGNQRTFWQRLNLFGAVVNSGYFPF